MRKCLSLVATCLLLSNIQCYCYDPSPAFPLPKYDSSTFELQDAFREIAQSLKQIVSSDTYDRSSFSLEVTSSKETLWSLHHTARERNETRPGAPIVNGTSVYRIASVTKAFTVLGVLQQHIAGNLDLDDTIDKYIPELQKKQKGSIPWKDITLRTLGSQLSGIPNDFAQSDLLTGLSDPIAFGLPPVTKKGLPSCGSFDHHNKPCHRKDLLDSVMAFEPMYPPKQQSTYCNIAYELLGLALEKVTGKPYADAISSSILTPFGMNHTSIRKPADEDGVIPKGVNYWDANEGVQNPTGGLYSTSTDLSIFLRYILTHYNGLTPTLNWLHPASYAAGMNSFFGMPWEIFRTDDILPHTNRAVTFVTKSGGVPAYFSIIIALPEYDLGLTILVAGESALLDEIREALTVPLVRAAEAFGQRTLRERYTGKYNASRTSFGSLNSSITLSQSAHAGLYIDTLISNGTDTLSAFGLLYGEPTDGKPKFRAQLTPTLLFRDEKKHKGEIWRMEIVPERKNLGKRRVWDEFCITHVDNIRYGGVPLNEVVFWGGENGEAFEEIELAALRVRLRRQEGKLNESTSPSVVAGLKEQVQQVIKGQKTQVDVSRERSIHAVSRSIETHLVASRRG